MQSLAVFHELLNDNLKKVGFGTLTSVDDYVNLALGVIDGMIGVLPPNSILAYCKNNATSSYTQALLIRDNYIIVK